MTKLLQRFQYCQQNNSDQNYRGNFINETTLFAAQFVVFLGEFFANVPCIKMVTEQENQKKKFQLQPASPHNFRLDDNQGHAKNRRDNHAWPTNAAIQTSLHHLENLDHINVCLIFHVIHIETENVKQAGKPRDNAHDVKGF